MQVLETKYPVFRQCFEKTKILRTSLDVDNVLELNGMEQTLGLDNKIIDLNTSHYSSLSLKAAGYNLPSTALSSFDFAWSICRT